MPNESDWTYEKKMKALELWNAGGLSLAEIGQAIAPGFSKSAMNSQMHRLRRAGYAVREAEFEKAYWTPEVIREIHRLFNSGWSITKIAKHLKLDHPRATRSGIGQLLSRTNARGEQIGKPKKSTTSVTGGSGSIAHQSRHLRKDGSAHATLARRPPYEAGHPVTWSALNSLLPNVGPLVYNPEP